MTSTPSGGYCCKFSFSLKSRHFNLPNSHKSSKKLFFFCAIFVGFGVEEIIKFLEQLENLLGS
ncbi:hypothetical protein IC575_003995 [Cucumis melo]